MNHFSKHRGRVISGMTCTWLMPDAPDKHGRAFRPGVLLITHAPKIEQKQNKEKLLLVLERGLAFSRSKVKRTIHTRRGSGRRLQAGSMVRNEDNTPKLKNVQLVECLPQTEEKKPYASNADENKARSQAGERCFLMVTSKESNARYACPYPKGRQSQFKDSSKATARFSLEVHHVKKLIPYPASL